MIKHTDYTKENGDTDWTAYRKAQIDVGERCYQCKNFIVFETGHRSLCSECKKFQNDGNKVTSSNYYRCPKCGNRQEMTDQYEFYNGGEHNVMCNECEHEFTVTTWVTLTIESPELMDQSNEYTPHILVGA